MKKNFTPLNVEKIKDKKNDINFILLAILTFTTFILAILLFVLIQKKVNPLPATLPEIIPTPTAIPSLPVPTLVISPNKVASGSSNMP